MDFKKTIIALSLGATAFSFATGYVVVVDSNDVTYEIGEGYSDSVSYTSWASDPNNPDSCSYDKETNEVYFDQAFSRTETCLTNESRTKTTTRTYVSGKVETINEEETRSTSNSQTVAATGTHLETTCKGVREFDSTLPTGEYVINPQGNITVLCGMDYNGGGWTYILGMGSFYNKSHSFWDGVNPNDNVITTYNGHQLNTTDSAKLIASLPFTEMLFTEPGGNFIYPSNVESTFVQKKAAKTPFTGLTWDYNAVSGGYTVASYLLGRTNGAVSFDDYPAKGLGIYGYASSRGTYYGTRHIKPTETITCGNQEYCTYSHNYRSSASIGKTGHRYVNSRDGITGLFFR